MGEFEVNTAFRWIVGLLYELYISLLPEIG
jgi:hypothetical protein